MNNNKDLFTNSIEFPDIEPLWSIKNMNNPGVSFVTFSSYLAVYDIVLSSSGFSDIGISFKYLEIYV